MDTEKTVSQPWPLRCYEILHAISTPVGGVESCSWNCSFLCILSVYAKIVMVCIIAMG